VASVWPICAMRQQSGPGNTPCSGWRLKILWPAFRRLESPRQSGLLPRDNRRPHLVAEPRARNGIFAARDKAAKSAVLPTQRRVGAYQTSQDAANAAFSREVSENAKFRECVVVCAVICEPVSLAVLRLQRRYRVNAEIAASFADLRRRVVPNFQAFPS
jgi:hypothetical protein